MKTTSTKGIELIKRHEGLRLDAYQCPAGKLTIGYGHTGKDVVAGDRITQGTAERLLQGDLRWAENTVNEHVKKELNQNQFDALVSFTFNVGPSNFKSSTLLKRVNANTEDPDIAKQFARWNKADGKELAGLTRRRADEAKLYFS